MHLLREILGGLVLIALSPVFIVVALAKFMVEFIIGGFKSVQKSD